MSGLSFEGGFGRSITCIMSTSIGRSLVKGRLAGGELVEDDTERVDVGARVDGLVADLLRRHVRGRPDDLLRVGQADERRVVVADDLLLCSSGTQCAMPKSQTFTSSVTCAFVVLARDDDDVLGLDVAVHDACVVRVTEPRAGLRDEVDEALERQRARRRRGSAGGSGPRAAP